MKDTSLSVRMKKEERDEIQDAAMKHNETLSSYSKRVLLESVRNPLYTGKDVIQILEGISYDMTRLRIENQEAVISEINRKGEALCRILSTR